jgi:hypothetical protein
MKVIKLFLESSLSGYAITLAIFPSLGRNCASGLLGTIILLYLLWDLIHSRCLLHLLLLILIVYLLDHIVSKSLPASDVDYFSGRTVVITRHGTS